MVYDAREVGFMVRQVHTFMRKHSWPKEGYHRHHWSYKLEHAMDYVWMKSGKHRASHSWLKLIDNPTSINLGYYEDLEGNVLDTKMKHLRYLAGKQRHRKSMLHNFNKI